jgi:CheY-like chemotaxis protein
VSTILVVQADPELNDGWCLALEASGHTVLTATATQEGIARVREGGIDVVVVEPVANRGLRQLVDELHRLPDAPPFVLVSSSPDAPEISARLGAAALLLKPCTARDLDEAIGRLAPGPVSLIEHDEPTVPRSRRR